MAWEAPVLVLSFPTTSTGLRQYSLVDISTSGNLIDTANNGTVIGVLQEGTTGSTRQPRSLPVMVLGVSKLRSPTTGSTHGVGELVAAATNGWIKGAVAASYPVGRIVAGTSNDTGGHVLSILLAGPTGSTAWV